MSGGQQRKRIVVVEDHPGLREQVIDSLTEAGYDVAGASDARAAKVLITATTPDLVCVDLVLPEGSGYELCEHIRATPALSRTKVLVMSGRALPTDRAFAEEAGAEAFLAKPFTDEALLELARELLTTTAANEAA